MTNDGSLSNSAKRTELYNKAQGTSTYSLRRMNRNNSDPIKSAYDDMQNFLIDNPIDTSNADDLRKNLILAGFEDLPVNDADLTTWANDRQNMIKKHAQKAYDMYATEKSVYLDNAKMSLVEDGGKQDTYINFIIDDSRSGETPVIKGIEIAENAFGAEAISSTLTSNDGNNFKGNDKLHVYNFYYNKDFGKNGPRLYIEISGYDENGKDKDGQKLSLDFIKEKLKLKLQERAEENKITCSNAPDKCDTKLRDNLTEISAKIDTLKEKDLQNPDIFNSTLIDRTIVTEYKSYAQKIGGIEGNNLRYSDFGLVKWDETRTNVNDSNDKDLILANKVFAGGYDALKITPDKSQTMHFEGDAVGGVNYKQINTNDELQNSSTLELKGKATLDFKQGNENLTANFNNWYDVNVNKNLDGSNSITFSNGDKENFGNGIKESATINDFKFKGFDTDKFNNDLGKDNAEYKSEGYDTYKHNNFIKENWDPNSEGHTGAMDIGYYGENGKPSEATGYVMYHTETKNNPAAGSANDLIDVLEVQIGVGMQKK